MPSDDLRSVPGLKDNHRRALAGKLGITSLRALADADQRAIHTALGTIRPRPSLARIAAWQEEAHRLSDTELDRSAWHTRASFAVIFAQRQADGAWEHRLEAEQTEVEPPAEPRQWPGWDCGPLCDWMLGQLDLSEDPADSMADEVDRTAAVTGKEPGARAGRAELRITSATITDARHTLSLIKAGRLTEVPRQDLSPPVHLRLTVSGARRDQQLRAAVWFRRQGAPGWSPHEPVTVPRSGPADFDLSSVPPGPHNIRLLAWATDPGATLAAITLPKLTFEAAGPPA